MEAYEPSIAGIASGERVALAGVEITSIPHYTVTGGPSLSPKDATTSSAEGTRAFLDEIHRSWQAAAKQLTRNMRPPEFAIELLWVTSPIGHQAYRAQIRLFILVRVLGPTNEAVTNNVKELISIVSSWLTDMRYEWHIVSFAAISHALNAVQGSNATSVSKKGGFTKLQNPIVPVCYTWDIWQQTDNDLARVVDALADHPNCALSVQLIPTALTPNEAAEIDRQAQALEQLSRGITSTSVGSLAYALTAAPARAYRLYAERKRTPLFLVNTLVFGSEQDRAVLAGRIASSLITKENTSTDLSIKAFPPNLVNLSQGLHSLPWMVSEQLITDSRTDTRANGSVPTPLLRMPQLLFAEEATELFRLPIGSERVGSGLVVRTSRIRAHTYAEGIINAGDIELGRLANSPGRETLGLALPDLAKHMLITGTPGSGKTTFTIGLLEHLWNTHHVPFFVIEPAKTEYRALIDAIPDLQVFTPGKSLLSPFVFNPFLPPAGVRIESYKSTLKTAFEAGISMTTPLDKIFEQAIANCYSDHHWLDTSVAGGSGRTFNMDDFIASFHDAFRAIGYTGDVANIGRAGEVRLRSVSKLFDTYHAIPLEDLLARPTVVELAAIENSDEKALLIALLLLQILAYVNANYLGEGGLRNLIVLEEAHVLLDSNNSGGDAQPTHIAQGLLKRMLAETRSYGVGIAVADQSPRKVGPDIVALTDIKVTFRIVEREDRRIIADSTNMEEEQELRLGRLKPGEALAFFSRLDEPEEIMCSNHRVERGIAITISDDELARRSTYWASHPNLTRPYPECETCACCTVGCDWQRRILARDVARRVFVHYLSPNERSIEPLKILFSHISRAVTGELDGEPLTHELMLCVKVHLWRRIRYQTKIPITNSQIEGSLRR